jgi:hypothetical protein
VSLQLLEKYTNPSKNPAPYEKWIIKKMTGKNTIDPIKLEIENLFSLKIQTNVAKKFAVQ